jgi:predicted acylesterase/phospholipase RssA
MVSPVEINGRFYCDGGVTDNLPVDALPAMGADYLIAVDLFMPSYRRGLGFWGATTAAIELLIRSSGGGANLAHCLIVPELSGHNYFDFSRHKSEEYIALGEAAAERMIPTIIAAITAPVEETRPLPFLLSQPVMPAVLYN